MHQQSTTWWIYYVMCSMTNDELDKLLILTAHGIKFWPSCRIVCVPRAKRLHRFVEGKSHSWFFIASEPDSAVTSQCRVWLQAPLRSATLTWKPQLGKFPKVAARRETAQFDWQRFRTGAPQVSRRF